MGAQLRVYRRRIRSVQSTKKITKAMELIASSRIVKAQARLEASLPYLTHLYAAISAAATGAADVRKHPLMANAEERKSAAVLIITADRGLAKGCGRRRAAPQLHGYIRQRDRAGRLQGHGRGSSVSTLAASSFTASLSTPTRFP